MVKLDRHDYINKAMDLLAERDTYEPVTADPTSKHKNKLINMLWTIKAEGGLGGSTYKTFPTGTQILWTTQDTQQGHTPLGSLFPIGVQSLMG